MTYLITGGAGFIGSALVRQLISSTTVNVVNVDKLTYAGNLESLRGMDGNPRYAHFAIDICDAALLREVFAFSKPNAVIHLAAESHVDRSIDSPAEFIHTNILGTYTLLEEARRQWNTLSATDASRYRFIHVSTDEVFGSLGADGLFAENTPYDPSSPYSASKASADHIARAWHRTYGLPVIVTNCSNNYGPFQFPEKLIPLCILKALSSSEIPVYGSGKNSRDWLYVDDHVRALLLVLVRGIPGRTYNIGGGSEWQNLDLVHTICRLLDELRPDPAGPYERLITFVPDRPGHDLRYAMDATRMHEEIGWHPEETLDSGLRKTVVWYLENQDWAVRIMSGAYRGERLGLASQR